MITFESPGTFINLLPALGPRLRSPTPKQRGGDLAPKSWRNLPSGFTNIAGRNITILHRKYIHLQRVHVPLLCSITGVYSTFLANYLHIVCLCTTNGECMLRFLLHCSMDAKCCWDWQFLPPPSHPTHQDLNWQRIWMPNSYLWGKKNPVVVAACLC